MASTFPFTVPDAHDEVDLFEEERIGIRRIRQDAPQLAEWSDAQVADAWGDFSRDLRGLSWSDPSCIDARDFLAFVMVKELFPEVDARAVGYEAFQQLGRDEPWMSWPEAKWPTWTSA